MLLNNAISIISNARLALGNLGLDIAENVQKGLNSTDTQKDLYRRLTLTYAILKVLDPIIKINEDDTIEYILGGYDHAKINRLLLYLRDISKSGNLPVVSLILNPISEVVRQGGSPQPGNDGQSAFLYVGYADDASGTGYSTSPAGKTFVAFRNSATPISPVTAGTFAGLWRQFVGANGANGSNGTNGTDGESAFVYIAYADADDGTGFTLTFDANKDYIAILTTDTEIPSPVDTDFTGLWKNYKGPIGETGGDGVSYYVYTGYADADDGTGFTLVFDPGKDYIAFLTSLTELSPPVQTDFDGLWKNYKGEPGDDGADGNDGNDGADAFLYIAYADDAIGTNFTLTYDPNKEFIAFLSTDVEIPSPELSDFTGLFRRYKGDGDRYATFSTTSMTIGTGTYYLQVETGLSYTTAQRVIMAVPNDINSRMEGMVIFYDQSDGQMQVEVDNDFGAGTFAQWDVNLAGAPASLAGTDAYFATLATDQGSGGAAQTLSGTPAIITAFDTVVSESAGMDADATNNDITISNNGSYVLDFNATISGDANAVVLFQIYRNGVAEPNFISRLIINAAGDPQNILIHGVIQNGMQNDVFDVRATDAGGDDIIVEQARFSVYTIGFLNTEQFADLENADVDIGTETCDTFSAALGNAAEYKVLVKKGLNIGQFYIMASWDGTNQPTVSVSSVTPPLGTIDITLAVDFSGGSIRLRASATSDDWLVKGKRAIIG